MLEGGYIKLHRSLLKWEWYDDANTFRVFLHLLLTVNVETCDWHGFRIERGSRISSYAKLAEELKLSRQQIRTAIKKLTETGEISTNAESKQFTVFTVNNYDKFQQITNEQPTSNQRITNEQPQSKKVKEYNTNILTSTSTAKNHSEEFSVVSAVPTLDEVSAYIHEIGGGVDAVKFFETYSSRGWKAKNGGSLDWRQAVRYWQKTEGRYQARTKPSKSSKKNVPESPMADAYRSLIYNLDE